MNAKEKRRQEMLKAMSAEDTCVLALQRETVSVTSDDVNKLLSYLRNEKDAETLAR